MVNCLGTVWLWGWAPRNLHGVGGDYLGEPTLMLVEISNKNTNKQEVYTLLISFQYKESDYLENNFRKQKTKQKKYAFKRNFSDASSYEWLLCSIVV